VSPAINMGEFSNPPQGGYFENIISRMVFEKCNSLNLWSGLHLRRIGRFRELKYYRKMFHCDLGESFCVIFGTDGRSFR
jgi:hypothetical protein